MEARKTSFCRLFLYRLEAADSRLADTSLYPKSAVMIIDFLFRLNRLMLAAKIMRMMLYRKAEVKLICLADVVSTGGSWYSANESGSW